jgi:methyltransferase (TIGR00027 family)
VETRPDGGPADEQPTYEQPAIGLSRTSQAVALIRTDLDRPASARGDADAQRKLCAGMRPANAEWVRPQLTARTRFFDTAVQTAIAAGTRQVVICGAGYDDRALRFRTPGVRFFELDHPATQADKARRLRAASLDAEGLTLAPADFRTDDVPAVLAAAGHQAGEPTLFLTEGLLVYLDQAAIVALLTALATRAGAGSVLAASLAVHAPGADSAQVRRTANARRAANARRRAADTEPWRTILPPAAHLELLTQAGWTVQDVTDVADLATGLERDRGLLVTAIQPAA